MSEIRRDSTEIERPAPEVDLTDLEWARQRLAREAGRALADARVYGRKLLRGFGYPDEVFCRAQDYRAIVIVLTALLRAEQANAELAALRQAHAALRANVEAALASEEQSLVEQGKARIVTLYFNPIANSVRAALAPRPERTAP